MYTKKRNEIGMEDRCIINGDIAVKPYYYLRNGLLHVRHTVDRAVNLSKDEEMRVKEELNKAPAQKQQILGREWNLQTVMNEKPIIMDGIKAAEKRMNVLSSRFGGRKKHMGKKHCIVTREKLKDYVNGVENLE